MMSDNFVDRADKIKTLKRLLNVDEVRRVFVLFAAPLLGKTALVENALLKNTDNRWQLVYIDVEQNKLPIDIYYEIQLQMGLDGGRLSSVIRKIRELFVPDVNNDFDDKREPYSKVAFKSGLKAGAGRAIPVLGDILVDVGDKYLSDRKYSERERSKEFLFNYKRYLHELLFADLEEKNYDKFLVIVDHIDSVDKESEVYEIVMHMLKDLFVQGCANILITTNTESHASRIKSLFDSCKINLTDLDIEVVKEKLVELDEKYQKQLLNDLGVHDIDMQRKIMSVCHGHTAAIKWTGEMIIGDSDVFDVDSKYFFPEEMIYDELNEAILGRVIRVVKRKNRDIESLLDKLCVPRLFNVPIASRVTGMRPSLIRKNISEIPFINRCKEQDTYYFHGLIRDLLLRDVRCVNEEMCFEMHKQWYKAFIYNTKNKVSKYLELEALYHLSYIDEIQFTEKILSFYLDALRYYDIEFYPSIIECLRQTQLKDKLLWIKYFQARRDNDWELIDSALEAYQNVIDGSVSDKRLKAHAHLSKAYVLSIDKGKYYGSIKEFEESRLCFECVKDLDGVGFALTGVGRAELNLNSVSEGRKALQIAKDHYDIIKERQEIQHDYGLVNRYLGWSKCLLNEMEDAKNDVLRSCGIHEKSGCDYELAEDMRILARIEYSMGNNEESLRLLNESLKVYEKLRLQRHVFHRVLTCLDLSRLYCTEEKLKDAQLYYNEACRIHEIDGQKITEIELLLTGAIIESKFFNKNSGLLFKSITKSFRLSYQLGVILALVLYKENPGIYSCGFELEIFKRKLDDLLQGKIKKYFGGYSGNIRASIIDIK